MSAKKLHGVVCVFGLLLTFAASVSAQEVRVKSAAFEVVEVLPTQIFVPPGFDDNDNVQIMLDGSLRDTSYQKDVTEVSVDKPNRRITIRQRALHFTDEDCFRIPMLKNYTSLIELGRLDEGEYEVVAVAKTQGGSPSLTGDAPQQETKTLGKFSVAKAESKRRDNSLYAPIEDVTVQFESEESGSPMTATLVLTAVYPNSCWRTKDVFARYITRVIEVRPTVEVKTGPCLEYVRREKIRIPLNTIQDAPSIKVERNLIHVRTMEGNAINRVVQFF